MKRYEREYEVWRDKKTGRITKAPGRSRAANALRHGAAALNLMEDRTGKRLRFGEETNGWDAAHIFKEDRAGRRSYGETSARSGRAKAKAGLRGVGPAAIDYREGTRAQRRARVTAPTRTPRKRTGYYDVRDRRGRFTAR